MPNRSTGAVILLQQRCLRHRFIRSRDDSDVVERPERLRAVHLGLSAAICRIGHLLIEGTLDQLSTDVASDGDGAASLTPTISPNPLSTDDLAASMANLNIVPSTSIIKNAPQLTITRSTVDIIYSDASVDMHNNAAVKFIHGDIDGDVYLDNLSAWVNSSAKKISQGESEIPEGLSQGDLYLCPESQDAIEGALGTACEAVDTVMSNPSARRAFVAIRPPGHHCGEDTPSGFCFVNNVAVAAAHAHLKHGINRVIIFDIDLHHGNGTQSIAWQINEEAYRKDVAQEYNASQNQRSLRMFYGSLHDVLSFPCEDGEPALVQAASTSLHGPHGQYIENVHLRPYSSEDQFWEILYKERYSKLFDRARGFVHETGSKRDDILVFISCGFDACEHEYESMSRHGRKVPTSFYYRFASDARHFADDYACGRLISVLEGGYSDRALTSGAMAHLTGLVDLDAMQAGLSERIDERWWSVDNLIKLEKSSKKRKGGRQSAIASNYEPNDWLADTLQIFSLLDTPGSNLSASNSPSPLVMKLRDRGGSKPSSQASSPVPSPKAQKVTKGRKPKPQEQERVINSTADPFATDGAQASTVDASATDITQKGDGARKLPRVVLKLGRAVAP